MAVSILKEPPITSRDAFIPYLVTAVNMLAPTIAARGIIQSPQIYLISIIFIFIGVPCSVYFRQRQYNRSLLNVIVMVPLLLLTWSLVKSHPGLQLNWSDPLGYILAHDSYEQLEGILNIFTLLAAGRAFLLISPADLIQTPLPSISIFLLAVITDKKMESDPFVLGCLLIMFATSIYLFSHEQGQQWFAIHMPLRVQQRLLIATIGFTLLLFPLLLLFGSGLRQFNLVTMAEYFRNRSAPHTKLPFALGRNTFLSNSPTLDMSPHAWLSGRQLIMTVTTKKSAPQNLLWRGRTYALYIMPQQGAGGLWSSKSNQYEDVIQERVLDDGEGWRRDTDGMDAITDIDYVGDTQACDPGIVELYKEQKTLGVDLNRYLAVQKYDIKAPLIGISAPVYGAYQILRVRSADQKFAHTTRVSTDGSVSLAELPQDTEIQPYIVESIIKPMPTTLRLKKNPSLPNRNLYLQMPGGNHHITGQTDDEYTRLIRRKAIEILALHALTPESRTFDIIHQLELYLIQNYHYTLNPKPPKGGPNPLYRDPIVDFLYTQKAGYCTYYSGAMVMLCRSIGIPARIVVGFATGEIDEDATKENNDFVTYRVTANDAHSWAEVYLPNYGWYTSDPTAGSRTATSAWGAFRDGIASLYMMAKSSFNTWVSLFRQHLFVRIITIMTLVLILAGLSFLIYLRIERPPKMPVNPLTDREATALVVNLYHRMHRWMLMWGVMKPDGLTAMEFQRQFQTLNPVMGEPVAELTRLYLAGRYGPTTLTDADARRAVMLMHDLWLRARQETKHLAAAESNG